MPNDDRIDLISLHLARIGKEKSTALPAKYYSGDPANHVEFPAEVERQEKARKPKRTKGK